MGEGDKYGLFYSFGIFLRYCGDCRGNILSLIFVGFSTISPLLPGNKKPEGEAGSQRGGGGCGGVGTGGGVMELLFPHC